MDVCTTQEMINAQLKAINRFPLFISQGMGWVSTFLIVGFFLSIAERTFI